MMEWYKSLSRKQKVNIREVFFLATGKKLSDMIMIFSFAECMDILYFKLKLEGFDI